MEKQLSKDEKIIKYSGVIGLGIFLVCFILGFFFPNIGAFFFASVFFPLFTVTLALSFAFPFLSFISPEIISKIMVVKIIFLLANICAILFYLRIIIINIVII